MKESWRLINKITNRKSSKQGIIKRISKQERVNKWCEHFSNLLGKEIDQDGNEMFQVAPIIEDLDINDEEFTLSEVALAKKSLKDGKHPVPDKIPPDVLKKCAFDDIILNLANRLLKDSLKPDQWSEIDILPLPKSGDLSDTSNYRGISLSSLVAKLINKMILNRIQSKLDTHLRPNQNGFHPGRSTSSQILALRRIIERVKSRNKKAIIVYVDFKKAFDSIDRRKMLEILKAYAVPTNLRKAIARFYENTKARVITPDDETEFFYVKKSLLQNLDYADDLALSSEQMEQAQESLHRLETEAEKVGLYCNSKKTEDYYQSVAEKDRLVLYKNVKNGRKRLMAKSHLQRNALRRSSK
eukprot:gene5809-6507_t